MFCVLLVRRLHADTPRNRSMAVHSLDHDRRIKSQCVNVNGKYPIGVRQIGQVADVSNTVTCFRNHWLIQSVWKPCPHFVTDHGRCGSSVKHTTHSLSTRFVFDSGGDVGDNSGMGTTCIRFAGGNAGHLYHNTRSISITMLMQPDVTGIMKFILVEQYETINAVNKLEHIIVRSTSNSLSVIILIGERLFQTCSLY